MGNDSAPVMDGFLAPIGRDTVRTAESGAVDPDLGESPCGN